MTPEQPDLPVDGPFDEDALRELSRHDVAQLRDVMRRAPVDEPFTPSQALELARCPDLSRALALAEEECGREQGPISAHAFVQLARAEA